MILREVMIDSREERGKCICDTKAERLKRVKWFGLGAIYARGGEEYRTSKICEDGQARVTIHLQT